MHGSLGTVSRLCYHKCKCACVALEGLKTRIHPCIVIFTIFFHCFQDAVDAEVKALLSLKAQYKELTGEDLPGGGGGRKDKKKDKKADKAKEEKAKAAKAQENAANNGASKEVGKVTRYFVKLDSTTVCLYMLSVGLNCLVKIG